jgi:hypothetical protein
MRMMTLMPEAGEVQDDILRPLVQLVEHEVDKILGLLHDEIFSWNDQPENVILDGILNRPERFHGELPL